MGHTLWYAMCVTKNGGIFMKHIKFSNKLTNDEKRFLYKLEREIESGDVYAMEEWATFLHIIIRN